MVSAAISWYGATKPFFVNENGIKVTKENYCKHLEKQLFPAIKKLVKHDDWIFVQDRINHIDQISYKISLKKL